MGKNKIIKVDGSIIHLIDQEEESYISLTDIVKNFDGDQIIKNWLQNNTTMDFLEVWEAMHNPDFNLLGLQEFKAKRKDKRFIVSVHNWVEHTNAMGIYSKKGKNGGTYAHNELAFEFASWLSPTFKILLFKEFKRLKNWESNNLNLEWDYRRFLTKVNYRLQTDAVQKDIIPYKNLPKNKEGIAYAREADLLNVAVFGMTAKQWTEQNPQASLEGKNIREMANIAQLTVISNLESLNSDMIRSHVNEQVRYEKLCSVAVYQLESLNKTLPSASFVLSEFNADNSSTTALPEYDKLSTFNRALTQAAKHNSNEGKK
ncbi:MAG: KilA-N domain-containing protein [Flavobacteriales bacterium]|nr:KilA-N domain-containing protein [Flavobacteriales bacterium]